MARYNIDRIAKIRSNLFQAVRERAIEREKSKPALPTREIAGVRSSENNNNRGPSGWKKVDITAFDAHDIESTIFTPGGQGQGGGPPPNGDPVAPPGGGTTEGSAADGSAPNIQNNFSSDPSPTTGNPSQTASPWVTQEDEDSFTRPE